MKGRIWVFCKLFLLAVGSILIALAVSPSMILIFLVGYSIFIAHNKKAGLIISTLLILGFTLDWFQFTYLPQAKSLLDRGWDLMQVIESDDYHSLRFIAVYPSVLLEEYLRIDIDEAFTYYILILSYFFLLTINRFTLFYTNGKQSRTLRFYMVVLPLFFAVLPLINGRVILPYLGMALVLLHQCSLIYTGKFQLSKAYIYILGMFLATVSSGIVIILFLQVCFGIYIMITNQFVNKYRGIIFVGFSAVLFLPYVMLGITKNLDFFDEDILKLLSHGLGRLLTNLSILDIIMIMLIGFLGVLFVLIINKKLAQRNKILLPIVVSIEVSIVGSLFGFLTGTMLLPGLLSLIIIGLNRINASNDKVQTG